MNERIKLLIEQATIRSEEYLPGNDGHPTPTVYFDKEKFAELIVKECAEIAYKTSWDDLVHGYGQAVIPLHLHNTIKQHFGVEE